MFKNYLKDNISRHKKEKEIDRFIYNDYKHELIKSKQETKHLDKVNQIKLNRKRFRDEALSNKKKEKYNINQVEKKTVESQKIEEIQTEIDLNEKEKEENLSNNKVEKKENSINIKNYVDRILKHISKEESFEKCLNLLKTLLINYSSELKPLVIFKIFNRIINLDFKFKTPSNVKTIKELFDFVCKLHDSQNENENENMNSKEFEILKDGLSLCFITQLNMITDDSFKV